MTTTYCKAGSELAEKIDGYHLGVQGTLDEMEPKLRELGYTALEMMAGPVDLAIVDPYGMRRVGSVNIQTEKWAHHVWRGKLVEINGKPYLTDAKEPTGPFVAGLFPLV